MLVGRIVAVLVWLVNRASARRIVRIGRGRDFNKRTCLHIVDVAVDRDVLRHERILANLAHVLHHAFGEVGVITGS